MLEKSTTSKPAKHFEKADEVHPFAQSGYKLLQCNDEPLLYNVSRFTHVTGSIYMAHEFPTMIISSVSVFFPKRAHTMRLCMPKNPGFSMVINIV